MLRIIQLQGDSKGNVPSALPSWHVNARPPPDTLNSWLCVGGDVVAGQALSKKHLE